MSETSWRSSAGDSSVKSRLRSRSVADATWRRAVGQSGRSSPDGEPASSICVPEVQPAGSAEDDAGDAAAPSAARALERRQDRRQLGAVR